MRSERLGPVPAGGDTALQEIVAGLNAVVMLGSCLHAAPSSQDAAELAAGGLAAVTRLPLAAVGWYPSGPDGPLTVTGRCAGDGGVDVHVATTLRRLCPQLHAFRPTRLDADAVPRSLRRAGVQAFFALPLRVSTESLGFLLWGGERGSTLGDLTLVQALGAQVSTALYVARIRESEMRRAQRARRPRRRAARAGGAARAGAGPAGGAHRPGTAGQGRPHDRRSPRGAARRPDLAARLGPAGAGARERRLPAYRGPPRESELARVLGAHHPDHDPRSVELATAAGVQPFLVQSVATDRETFGYLMVGSTALGPVDRTTFHGGRLVLALRLLMERSVAEAEERLGRDLIQDVLLRSGDGSVPAGLAVRLGYEDDGPAVVLALRVAGPDGAAGADRARRRVFAAVRDELRGAHRGLAGMIGPDIVVIIRADGAERSARRVLDRVAAMVPGPDVAVGISDVRSELRDLEPAYREALVAVAMAQRCPSRLLRFLDLGLHRLLFDVEHVDRVDEHVDRWIGPLLRYDAENKARLVETLRCYLAGAGHQGTARKLAIHPSTLKYRLSRIRSILGVDFAHPETRFNIELALRLTEGMRTLQRGSTRPTGA